jgi:hypothetical protein
MNIDPRYLMILANNIPYKSNKWLRRLGFLALFIIVAGSFLLFRALYQPINNPEEHQTAVMMMNIGLGISLIGWIGIFILTQIKFRNRKKSRKNFIDYCEKNGSLPPWPENTIQPGK